MLTVEMIKFAQKELNNMNHDAGPVDGILGNRTINAVLCVPIIPHDISKERKVIAFIQIVARQKGINPGPIDGYWGPRTDAAFEEMMGRHDDFIRPEDLPDLNPNNWPRQNYNDLVAFYGEVGENQSYVHLPYPHKLAWDPTGPILDRFKCHKLVAPSIERVLINVLDHYGINRVKELHLDLWGGCSVVREIRGGSGYSTHSWGISIDYDPANNRLKWGRNRASFAAPEYNAWWDFWEEEGWVSLGRSRNFDWMHVQAAKI